MNNVLGFYIASVYRHFRAELGNDLWVEGENNLSKPKDIFELRTTGPLKKIISQREYHLSLYVNLQIKFKKDNTKPFKIFDALNLGVTPFTSCITIKKYPDDPDEIFGHANLINGDVEIQNMGLMDPVSEIALYTVEGSYKLEVTT